MKLDYCVRHGVSFNVSCDLCDAESQPAPSQTGTPELLGESLAAFIKRHLREACSHWSAARGIDGNINEAECQAAAAFERRAKEGVEQLERELAEAKGSLSRVRAGETLQRKAADTAEKALSQAKREGERCKVWDDDPR